METVLMKESPELEEKLGAWIILTFYVYIFSSFVLGGSCQKRVQFIICLSQKTHHDQSNLERLIEA
jgi:hypothetical protein